MNYDINNPFEKVKETAAQASGNAAPNEARLDYPIPGPDQTVYHTPSAGFAKNSPLTDLSRLSAAGYDRDENGGPGTDLIQF